MEDVLVLLLCGGDWSLEEVELPVCRKRVVFLDLSRCGIGVSGSVIIDVSSTFKKHSV